MGSAQSAVYSTLVLVQATGQHFAAMIVQAVARCVMIATLGWDLSSTPGHNG